MVIPVEKAPGSPPAAKISLIIADDETLLREGVVTLLSKEQDIDVVGQCGTAEETLVRVAEKAPDILLLDVVLPGMDGLELLPRIKVTSPETQVIMLTGHYHDDLVIGSLLRGARGYLVKTVNFQDLARAIRYVHEGGIWAKRKVLVKVIDRALPFVR